MAAGSFDFNPEGSDVVLSEPATPILVCRYDSTQDSGSRYTYLPNVWCDQIQDKEGEPQTAQFRYFQFDFIADGSPGDGEDQDENPDYPRSSRKRGRSPRRRTTTRSRPATS